MPAVQLGSGEIKFTPKGLHGRGTVGILLGIDGELVATGYQPGAATLITGTVHAWFDNTNALLGVLAAQPQVLGFAVGQQFLGQPEALTVRHLQLNLPWDPAALMAFEDLREGRGFRLQLSLSALLTSHGFSEASASEAHQAPVLHRRHPEVIWHEELNVSRDDWHTVLMTLGRGLAVPLAVTLPDVIVGPEQAAVVQRLRRAAELMTDGDFKGSLLMSREAIELLRGISPAVLPLERDPRARDVDQRRYAVLQALFDLTSAAAHPDPVNRDVRWGRRDAMLVLASATSAAHRFFAR